MSETLDRGTPDENTVVLDDGTDEAPPIFKTS
jgi:hypothetical protein